MNSEIYIFQVRQNQLQHLRTKQGEIYPKSPVGCFGFFTDCIWLLILIVLGAANVYLYLDVMFSNEYENLFRQYDQFGNKCGQDTVVKDQPIAQLQDQENSNAICLKKCPNKDVDFTGELQNDNITLTLLKKSTIFLGNLCIQDKQWQQAISSLNKSNNYSKIVNEIPLVGYWFFLFLFISIILSQLQIQIMKYCANVIFHIVQVAFVIALLGCMAYGIQQFGKIKPISSLFGANGFYQFMDQVINIIMIAVPIPLITLYQIYLASKMQICLAIIEAGCDAFGDHPVVLTVPLFSMLMIILSVCFWMSTLLSMMGKHVIGPVTHSFMPHVSMSASDIARLVFGIINILQWIVFWLHFGEQTMCALFTEWYQRQDGQNNIPGTPYSFPKALFRTIICTGSVAVGAAMMGLARFIDIIFILHSSEQQIVLASYNSQYQSYLHQNNWVAWILENTSRRFTKYSYIHSSFSGDNFFDASYISQCTNMYNSGIFNVVQVTEVLMSTGCNGLICSFSTYLGYLFFMNVLQYEETPYGVLLIIFIGLQFVNSSILAIWDLATDCVMQCYFQDFDREGIKPLKQPNRFNKQLFNILEAKSKSDAQIDSLGTGSVDALNNQVNLDVSNEKDKDNTEQFVGKELAKSQNDV